MWGRGSVSHQAVVGKRDWEGAGRGLSFSSGGGAGMGWRRCLAEGAFLVQLLWVRRYLEELGGDSFLGRR